MQVGRSNATRKKGGPPATWGRGKLTPRASRAPVVQRSSDGFRNEHSEMRKEIARVAMEIASIPAASPLEQQRKMAQVVRFLCETIVPHSDWEEKVLYPAVDRLAGEHPYPFTSSMRYEHFIIGRSIDELSREASKIEQNAAGFLSQGNQLLGLILAHFEEEEAVLLPILDEGMSQEEFEREILSPPPEPHLPKGS